jgi:hypothetical protein
VKSNNVNGRLRIRASKDIGKLKRGRSKFRVYLENQRVYIKKAQLGEEESMILGWILKAHPAFFFWDDMKDALCNMMGETFKNAPYALFPKTIRYKRSKDGEKMSTNGITLQVTNNPGMTAADFRAEMVENWQKMTAKNGGTLFGKTFIPFGKEGDIGDEVMTNIIQQQNNLLRSTKQRIVQNLNDIDCPINIISGSGEEIDASTILLRDVFYQYKDSEGKQLIEAIDKTNTGGTYIFLFHEKKTDSIDNMLNNLDATLDKIGAWGECDVHYRYMTAYPISVVGRVATPTPLLSGLITSQSVSKLASLRKEVSTMTSSLENMADDIIAVRQDMKNMSARFCSDIADLKQLILNMSVNKRGRKKQILGRIFIIFGGKDS